MSMIRNFFKSMFRALLGTPATSGELHLEMMKSKRAINSFRSF